MECRDGTRSAGYAGSFEEIAEIEEGGRRACRECHNLEKLGTILPFASCVVRADGDDWRGRLEEFQNRAGGQHGTNWYLPLAKLGCGYLVSDLDPNAAAQKASPQETVLAINITNVSPAASAAVGWMLAGINRAASSSGQTLSFDELEKTSDGISRLGILRMDVDSLGDIFAHGLHEADVTLSRITNLSKLLAYFFGGHVSRIVDRDGAPWANRAQIIYSGGDDLFVVGAWSVMPALAREIRRAFGRFAGGNPAWGISAGLAIVSGSQPVSGAARVAGQMEEEAKQHRRKSGRSKDAIAFLGDVLGWEDLDVVADLTARLLALTGATTEGLAELARHAPHASPLARGWLHRIFRISATHREATRQVAGTATAKTLADIDAAARHGRWAWMAAYAFTRARASGSAAQDLALLQRSLAGDRWKLNGESVPAEHDVIWLLRSASVWADWLSRKRR